MTDTSPPPSPAEAMAGRAREAAWAQPVARLKVGEMPADALNLNVEGRQVVGALQGFGQLWQKTYRVRLTGAKVTPAEVVTAWKQLFPSFWPKGNRFYAPLTGITPGEVALLNLAMPGGMPFSTGMLVIYSDEESFTLMTPQGHFESGWITFSAYDDEGTTVAQVESLARTNDPFYEVGFLLFGHRAQEQFWFQTLTALANHFGVQGHVTMKKSCLDPAWQWRETKNVWHNAGIRTALYMMLAPVRWARRLRRHRRPPVV